MLVLDIDGSPFVIRALNICISVVRDDPADGREIEKLKLLRQLGPGRQIHGRVYYPATSDA